MGQRSSTDTVVAVIQAFLESRTWKQAELAKRLELSTGALRKRLDEMSAAGFPLQREEEHPHVFWSVPKDWFPGGLLIKRDEVPELLRLLARLPKGKARNRLLETIIERIPQQAAPASVVAPDASAREEQHLGMVEDSARTQAALRFRYFTASRGAEGQRHASVHRVFPGPPARFLATCHRSGGLKWFRVDNVTDASLDTHEPFRETPADAVDKFLDESLDGFHEETEVGTLSFFVRDPEARWVARNLLPGMKNEADRGGMRVTVRTTALLVVARYVAQLGSAAEPETPGLAAKVAEIAEGALRNATPRQT